jgi:hypothetical protein
MGHDTSAQDMQDWMDSLNEQGIQDDTEGYWFYQSHCKDHTQLLGFHKHCTEYLDHMVMGHMDV